MEATDYERILARIVTEIPDAVVFADRDGIIRLWNGGAEAVFGYAPSEAIGRSLDLIIPESLRARHWEGYFRVMETGRTGYGRDLLAVPGVRKDGARISLEFSVALIRDGEAVVGVAAVLRDVTARWKREKETREKLAELTARIGPK